MGYFDDNRKVRFDDLEESGKYSSILMEEVKKGNYHELKKLLDKEIRKDKDFMEPLLYAVKNEKGTYAIYEYYDSTLQDNISLATDIVRQEPELIEDTPVSRNREFILNVAPVNPKVVQYMDKDLKEDIEFTAELCSMEDDEITKYAAAECKMPDTILENSSLKENIAFMLGAVQQDATALEYASEELKNNYEFMKEACNNTEVIEYVVEHTDYFGEDALSATKDVVIDTSSNEAISGFEEQSRNIKEKIEQMQNEGETTELEELLKKDKQLQRHIRLFEKIQNREVDPVRAAKLIDKICVNIDENYKNQITKVLKLDEAIQDKQIAQEVNITQEDVEEKTINDGATVEGINEETGVIRAGIEITNEKGEQENEGTDIQRT